MYSKKPFDANKAKNFLDLYRRRSQHLFIFAEITAPIPEDFKNSVIRSRESACGRDGVPYSAYKANRVLSGHVLHNAFQDISLENPCSDLEELNTQRGWFAPKGAVAEDKTACIRTPDKFRTIFGSNCDTKLLSGTIAFCVARCCSSSNSPKSKRALLRSSTLSELCGS